MFEKFGMLAPRHSVRMLVASWNRKPSTSPAPRCGQRFAWQFNKTFRIWSLWKFLRHLGLSPRSYMKSLLCVLCPCGFFGETSWKHVVLKLGPNKCSVSFFSEFWILHMKICWWLSAKVPGMLVATPEGLQGLVRLANPLPELQVFRQVPKALKNDEPGTVPKNGASPGPLFGFTGCSILIGSPAPPVMWAGYSPKHWSCLAILV